MREIKFRAWDKSDNKMINTDTKEIRFQDEGSKINITIPGNVYFKFYSNGTCLACIDGDKTSWSTNYIVPMQYTGRKDKRRKEIYEGDIVRARGHYPGEGWFDTGEHDYDFIADVKWDNEKMAYLCNGYYLHETEEVEILGNIYENPELLEVK